MKKSLLVLSALTTLAAVAAPSVDFSVDKGPVRRELHSSGYAPQLYPRYDYKGEADVKAMGLYAARTHNWAIYNCAQRICDLGLVFPLAHLDPADSSNYYFDATDEALRLARMSSAGSMKIFYTLGNSTDYTGDVAFNGAMPTNFAHTAEVMTGIVKHYNEGWASGKEWGIEYWEIWNAPDDTANHWYNPDLTATELMNKFAEFYAVCLKKLKTEFDGKGYKFGGPGLSSWDTTWLTAILDACAAEGVAPDFISWQVFTNDPTALATQAETARTWLDNKGYTDTEIIIDEWHYIRKGSWSGITENATSQSHYYQAHDDQSRTDGAWAIDSGVFNLSALARLQYSSLDQAYYYGCGSSGTGPSATWAYKNYMGTFNKNFYSLCGFGEIMNSATKLVGATHDGTTTVLGATDDTGRKGCVLVSDYRSTSSSSSLSVNLTGFKYGISNVVARVLDKSNNFAPATVSYAAASDEGGTLTLTKNYTGSSSWFSSTYASSAFIVTFDILPHEHVWSAWTTNAVPTCTSEGQRTRTCNSGECADYPTVETTGTVRFFKPDVKDE